MSSESTLQALWEMAACEPDFLQEVIFNNRGGQLPSTFQIGDIASATIAAQALAAARLWHMRTGRQSPRQQISVDLRHSMAMFRADRYLTIDNQAPPDDGPSLFGFYQTGDGQWVQLHTNFPHHSAGVLAVLQCGGQRDEVAAAIRNWNADALETRLADAGMCASMIRSPEAWQAHPQAAAIATLPLFEIIRIGDAPPQPMSAAARPLSGVRVLDLSRIIAAPVGARALAAHGADVLAVSAAHLPNFSSLVIDTGRGKRAAQLDLRDAGGRSQLLELVHGADVFLQAYRPGSLAALGFSAEELCKLRPGLIHVDLSAYSHVGPWANRRGFDSLVQSATGIAYEEGVAGGLNGPGKLPCQALDYATGFLIAFATIAALQRRAVEGGSWQVRVSLAQTGRWLQNMPRRGLYQDASELTEAEIAATLQTCASKYGQVSAVAPVERMSATPAYFDKPPVPLGNDGARWW